MHGCEEAEAANACLHDGCFAAALGTVSGNAGCRQPMSLQPDTLVATPSEPSTSFVK